MGRVPKNVPKVTWEVTKTAEAQVGGHPVIGKQLLGHVDNSSDPEIKVDIQMTLVVPADAQRPVPVMMMFGGRGIPEVAFPAPVFPGRAGARARRSRPMPPPANADPPATEQLIADGWGFAGINPGSIQADNGAGLTKGIIGLVNKGQPRKPDDWGALRAWGWGASRGLDYLETDKAVNAKQVGIEGVSRYGKAALVTMAFDTRFAVVLIGSSGEGGAKLHRRNWGEAVENLTGTGEYHWMAGNFLKYGASEATFGSKTAGDLPVDAHELIALCAPRLTFISYGVPEKGDAKWLDHQGSFMAAVAGAAGLPAARREGSRRDGGLSHREDAARQHRSARRPARLAAARRRTHRRAQLEILHSLGRQVPASRPPRAPMKIAPGRHRDGLAAARADRAGRSARRRAPMRIRRSRTSNCSQKRSRAASMSISKAIPSRAAGARPIIPQLLANWKKNFFGWNAADFGWGADRVENILWRLENGELDGVNPKVIVLLAGTNNVGSRTPPQGIDAAAANVTSGIAAVFA